MSTAKRPHILYILSDEHRGQAMTHAGDPNLRTPNMDRLAEEGVSFARAYCNCPVCTPSRGTIFSGRHAHAGPVAGFFDVYKPASPSTATVLRGEGYRTAYFGKWHCGVIRDQIPPVVQANPDQYKGCRVRTPENFRAGFQDWAGFEVINSPFETHVYRNSEMEPERIEGYQTDVLTDLAIEYLEGHDPATPLYLVLSVEPPHFVCKAPERFHRFDPEALEVRPNFARLPACFAGLEPEYGEATLRKILANYYACVENLDWNIGRLMEALGRIPGFEDTLVVYIADHGDFVGSHGMRTTKVEEHEESVRIPALFRAPGRIPARGLTDGMFSLVDLMATTLDLAGVPVPPWNQGTSWAPLLRGEPFAPPADVLLEMHGVPRWTPRFHDWRGIVTERWKYAFHENGREALFDLETDPYELHDLAAEQPDQCAAMRELLKTRLRETREPYYDVLIDHGVPEEPHTYLVDLEAIAKGGRSIGGLED